MQKICFLYQSITCYCVNSDTQLQTGSRVQTFTFNTFSVQNDVVDMMRNVEEQYVRQVMTISPCELDVHVHLHRAYVLNLKFILPTKMKVLHSQQKMLTKSESLVPVL